MSPLLSIYQQELTAEPWQWERTPPFSSNVLQIKTAPFHLKQKNTHKGLRPLQVHCPLRLDHRRRKKKIVHRRPITFNTDFYKVAISQKKDFDQTGVISACLSAYLSRHRIAKFDFVLFKNTSRQQLAMSLLKSLRMEQNLELTPS